MTTVAEIREYLLLLGWSEKQLQSQRPWNDFEKLEKLANEKGGTLRDTAAVHAALAAELAKAAADFSRDPEEDADGHRHRTRRHRSRRKTAAQQSRSP